ncbi:cilia- and flagella-associated protein 99-like isoform X1 [Syngnathoides biaculeatus]|uniref:cilia- and flagella-associated protein 99-like isoform X1 n=2 Tax=Syngnathoides biaculeatus TaxID=300417 RepID=UPI002ADDA4C1|nr:cilia- and flagella-associated protein 99-like isoform X1 [Syngnathoides biaculeatus]
MAKSHGELVKEAIVLLDKFTAGRASLDDFMEDEAKHLQDMEPESIKFILDLVSGCIEYKKLLDIVINPFFGQGGKLVSKRYHNHFVVICYLTIFHFDDLGLQTFSNIVRSLDIKSMHNFLSFFFMNLTTWIQDEWNRVYDVRYVKDHWIDPLLRKRSEIVPLMEKLAAKVSEGMRFRKAPPKTTDLMEFSFVKPKSSSTRQPQLSPLPEKHKKIPSSTYRTPKLIQILEEIKQRNHEVAEELLYEVNMKQFGFARPRRTDCTQRLRYQITEDLESRLQSELLSTKAPPPPIFKASQDTRPVKLNTAAMLRRRVLHDRHVEDKLQRIENLVEGAHEPSVFLQKEKEMRDKDHQKKLAKIEQKHASVILGHWEAVLARAQTIERNKKAARLKRDETVKRTQQNIQKRLEEEKEKKDLVQQVAEGHSNSQKATERVKKFKQSAVKDFVAHNQEIVRQAQEEAKVALTRKLEIISEIHAMECFPNVRSNMFDDTEIAGHELLGEMSHAELKERLFLMKEAEVNEQQKKRNLIQREKQKKKKLLLEDMENINLHSRAMAMANSLRKEEEKKYNLELQKTVIQDKKVLALQKKIEEVKKECQKLKKIESNKAKPSKQAAAHPDGTVETHSKDGLKKINWEDLEQSLERYIERKDPYVISHRGSHTRNKFN